MPQPTVIIICGPTAVGKTAAAIALAQQLQTQIISADSRQCYRQLNIGVAKPTTEELELVKHYFINSHDIEEEVNAGLFEAFALDAASQIFEKHSTAVMVGGTGLYIKAFAEGMDEMPVVDAVIRDQIKQMYQHHGLEFLQKEVAEKDPSFWKVAEQANPQRLMRALEVMSASGKSITEFRQGKTAQRPFNIIKVGLELPREQLYEQINKRVDQMVEQGLVDEVASLFPKRNINALQTVGYRELFDFFDSKVTLAKAIENIKTNTRHYAKRQMTWFKRDENIRWFNPTDPSLISSIIDLLPPNS